MAAFDETLFARLLTTSLLGRAGRHFETLGSTNDFLLREASLPCGFAVTAARQTAGRGRRGRKWETPAGSALALSVLCGPLGAGTLGYRQAAMLPFCCAAAAVEGLSDASGLSLAAKWPNDVIAPGPDGFYKVGGILCESVSRPDGRAVVCGFGVNLCQDFGFFRRAGLPHAASLRALGGRDISREQAAAALLNRLEPLLRRLKAGPPALPPEYAPLCRTLGRAVVFERDGKTCAGTAAALAPDGALLVDTAEGRVALHAGDVRIRGAGGLL